MKISYSKTVVAEISESEARRIARKVILKELDLPSRAFIREVWEDTGHGSGLDHKIRKVTPYAKALFKFAGSLD